MAVKLKPRPLLFLIVFAIFFIFIGLLWLYLASPVDSKNNKNIEVEITSGIGISGISDILKEKKLIRSKMLFKLYIKLYSDKSLKAGTYKLKQNMNLSRIVSTLESGSSYNPDDLKLTFKEGKRVTDYANVIADGTGISYDDVISVFKDSSYMSELVTKYWFLTDDILNDDIYYSLEGYLAPDTYYFEKDVTVKEIIEKMLDETDKELTEYKTLLGDNIHYYLTMASIVELEGNSLDDRKNIMGVFNNRMSIGMHLGSDVTTYYALQLPMSSKLTSDDYNTVNPYNTRPTTKSGPPVGPICNPSTISVQAAVEPYDNEYLYFVADSEGKIYYSKTSDEQSEVIQNLINNGKWNG